MSGQLHKHDEIVLLCKTQSIVMGVVMAKKMIVKQGIN